MFDRAEQLCYHLLKYPKVKSFSLIIPKLAYVELDVLSKLFETINNHLTLLHTLRINLPLNNDPFPALKKEYFYKMLSSLQNFSLNFAVENLVELLQASGQSLPTSMQSLSIRVVNEKSFCPVENIFKQNPKLSQIKRLELTDLDVSSLNIVNSLIDHFPDIECLFLKTRGIVYFKIEITTELIQTLSKLPRLTELHLWDFNISLLDDLLVKSLPNIRRLTIVVASYSLRVYIAQQYSKENQNIESVEPRMMYCRFLSCFAKQFPNLEHLTIKQFEYGFEDIFSSLCFTEFYHLKSLRLAGRKKGLTFTS